MPWNSGNFLIRYQGDNLIYEFIAINFYCLQIFLAGSENWALKMIFLLSRNFRINFDLKNSWKMNLRIIKKNHAADPEIGFLTK